MFKRALVLALLLVVLSSAAAALAQSGGDAVQGAALYAENCLVCHGPLGEARAAYSAFASTIAFNSTFAGATERGVAGTYMGPWGEAHGGPLSDAQITDLLAYAQTWTAGNTPPLPVPQAPTDLQALGGDANLGAALYAANCAGCHGPEGQGRGLALYPPIARDASFAVAVRRGVPDTFMPPFAQLYGGPLDETEIAHVVAYSRTWGPLVPGPGAAQPMPQGAGTLILLIGVGAVLLVGLAVLTRRADTTEPGESRS